MSIVSVIVPNYNHSSFLRQRINSILNQSFQDFELILLDDCSTDNSCDILQDYRNNPHVSHIVFNEVNSGSAFRQWNKGISLAKGDWIWIAESDDWAELTFLERMMQAVTDNPSCGLAFCDSYRTNEQGDLLWAEPDEKVIVLHRGESFICEVLSCYNAIVNVSSCLFKRSLFKAENTILYENMHLCGDWLFYVLLSECADVIEVKSPLNYCRRHGTNISEDAETRGLTFLEGINVLDYIIDRHPVSKKYYSRFWGRQWAKYEIIWNFTDETNAIIRKRFSDRHKSILRYHNIYRIRNYFRKCQR